MDKAWEWYMSGQLRLNAAKLNEDEFCLLLALRRHRDGDAIARVLTGDLDRLVDARLKHPDFACVVSPISASRKPMASH